MTAYAETPASLPQGARFRLILAGLMTMMGLAVIDANIVNTALPRIASDLGGASHMTWTITAFLLATTIAAPLYGKLSDLYGRRRLMIVSVSVFLFGSALCGAAQGLGQLVLFRTIQGLGAGGLVTLVQAAIGDLVAPGERGRYQAMFTTLFAVCSLAGPLLGGFLTSYLTWRWVFFINIPLGLLALALIVSSMPSLQTGRPKRIDYAGAALLAVTTTALLLLFDSGLSSQRAGASLLLLFILAVSLLLLAGQERRAAEPILDLGLFRNPIFSIATCATTTMSFAMLAALVLIPLYLQSVVGQTPMQAAMIVTPQILGMVASSYAGVRLSSAADRVGRLLLAGVAFEAVGLWGLVAAAGLGAAPWIFSATALLLGAGMGLGMPNAITLVQNAVGRGRIGVATGAISFFRSLGGAAGVALTGGVVAYGLHGELMKRPFQAGVRARLEQDPHAATLLTPLEHARYVGAYAHAIQAGFILCAAIITIALVSVLLLPRGPAPATRLAT